MKDFLLKYEINLESIILDNTLLRLSTVFLIIILAFFIRKKVYSLLCNLLFYFENKNKKRNFIRKTSLSFSKAFIASIIYFSLHSLYTPSVINLKIKDVFVLDIIEKIVITILFYYYFKLIKKFIYTFNFIKITTKGKINEQGNSLLRKILTILLTTFTILFYLSLVFGINIHIYLTSIGLIGAGLAFAFRPTIENVICSVIIVFDKLIEEGDSIKVKEYSGVVLNIGIRSSKILFDDNFTILHIPNSQIVESIIENFAHRYRRRVKNELKISTLTNKTSLLTAMSSITKTLTSSPEYKDSLKGVKVYFDSFEKNNFSFNDQ